MIHFLFAAISLLAGGLAWAWRRLLKQSQRHVTELLAENRRWQLAAETALASECDLRRMIDSGPALIWTSTPAGDSDYFSAQCEAFTGLPQPELWGWGWLQLLHPEDLEYGRSRWTESLKTHRDFEAEFRMRGADGSYRWLLCRALPVRDESGQVVKWVGASNDITERKQLEEEVQRARLMLKLAIRRTGIHVWDLPIPSGGVDDGRAPQINIWNLLAREDSKVSVNIASSVAALLHPDDRQRAMLQVEACIRGEVTELATECRVRRRDGSVVWSLVRGVVTRDATGTPLRLVGTSVDVTALKRAEEETRRAKRQLELAIHAAKISTWETWLEVEESGRPGSTPLAEFAGLSLEKMMSEPVHSEDGERVRAAAQACVAGTSPSFEVEYRVQHPDGSIVWRLSRGMVLRNESGRPICFTGIAIDVTELKRAQRELNSAKELAERANRAKDEFLANVSHEIRTPMNAILGMTELVLDSSPSEHQRQLLTTVSSAARSLLCTINDLLDFSQIEAGKLRLSLTPFALRASLVDTLQALSTRAQRKGLELICQIQDDVPDALIGDASRVRQVIMNLVGNAIKFTGRGEIVLEVARGAVAALERDIDLVITVRDSGIGIVVEKQEVIFQAFEQADTSTTRRYEGTGLGLTISARLAALMDGAISVASTPGTGSTFRFTARFARPPLPSAQPGSSAEPLTPTLPAAQSFSASSEALRILIVEDNELMLILLKGHFAKQGHRVRVAENGLVALALAKTGDFDLLLLDVQMPELDALTLLTAIRDHETASGHRLTIAGLGARLPALQRERYGELGVLDFLAKPLEAGPLLEIVNRVSARRTHDSAEFALLDPAAVLRACGGQRGSLGRICEAFGRSLPAHVERVRAAFEEQDCGRLREAAHMMYGTVAAFSSSVGTLVSTLEDAAQRDELETCEPLVERLHSLCSVLLDEANKFSTSAVGAGLLPPC